MPTYLINWSATVRGVMRVDAENAQRAEQAFSDLGDPPLDDCRIEVVAIEHIDEADPGVTWR